MDGDRARDLTELLEPTLSGARPARLPYSVRAQLVVAIIGGAFAVVGLCAASSQRIGTLRSDLWGYVPASLAVAIVLLALVANPEIVRALGGPVSVRYGWRLMGVAVLGCFYLRHRAVYKGVLLTGEQEIPSPWKAGTAAVLASWALMFALESLGRWLRV